MVKEIKKIKDLDFFILFFKELRVKYPNVPIDVIKKASKYAVSQLNNIAGDDKKIKEKIFENILRNAERWIESFYK